jgi:hypothetical protein
LLDAILEAGTTGAFNEGSKIGNPCVGRRQVQKHGLGNRLQQRRSLAERLHDIRPFFASDDRGHQAHLQRFIGCENPAAGENRSGGIGSNSLNQPARSKCNSEAPARHPKNGIVRGNAFRTGTKEIAPRSDHFAMRHG